MKRRDLLTGAAGVIGGAIVAGIPVEADGQATTAAPVIPGARREGIPTTPQGARSPLEDPTRAPVGTTVGASYTPLQDLSGTITPSDLHFERHHAGVPSLDPSTHTLTIHGLVDRPLTLTVDDIKRFPQEVHTYFVECAGNGRPAFRDPSPSLTVQRVAGMVSTSEWTGVRLSLLFREAGIRRDATWFLAEGADACQMTRSVPVSKAFDDALVVWAQNGEALRPAQGYPLRLLLPGWEGNINVKWLRRLELGTKPWMTRWETSKYSDPLKDGTARIFSYEMDAKSVITSPSNPGKLAARGWHSVNGLAWSGRGRISRVEVSTDGGATWNDAELLGPSLPKSSVRFQRMWQWDGSESVLLSRATDEHGYTQPTRTALIDARGAGTDYHSNHIVGWKVESSGNVLFHGTT
jgi:sulfane dehydrogenase subunit SoxC